MIFFSKTPQNQVLPPASPGSVPWHNTDTPAFAVAQGCDPPTGFPQIFSSFPQNSTTERQPSESWRNGRSRYLRTDDIGTAQAEEQVGSDFTSRSRGRGGLRAGGGKSTCKVRSADPHRAVALNIRRPTTTPIHKLYMRRLAIHIFMPLRQQNAIELIS